MDKKTCGSCVNYGAGPDGMYCYGGGRIGWTYSSNAACKYYREKVYTPSSGPCYVATAVYGSYDCPQVLILRRYRDQKLLASKLGRLFVSLYYKFSPPVANKLKDAKTLNLVVKKCIDWVVGRLNDRGL